MRAAGLLCIGKEAHRLEERPLVADPGALLNVYVGPARGPWATDVLPRLRALAAEPGGAARLTQACGLKPRALWDVLAGRSAPRAAVREALAALLAGADSIPPRVCPGCGTSLDGDPRRRHCSPACRKRSERRRRRALQRPTG
ncbi:MAG: hypothetical protein M3Q10_00200 [Chloroflexota bacterium]|nr:hypothetical protein [Chloroflexota bacterium]